jgi:hypothetical protein
MSPTTNEGIAHYTAATPHVRRRSGSRSVGLGLRHPGSHDHHLCPRAISDETYSREDGAASGDAT